MKIRPMHIAVLYLSASWWIPMGCLPSLSTVDKATPISPASTSIGPTEESMSTSPSAVQRASTSPSAVQRASTSPPTVQRMSTFPITKKSSSGSPSTDQNFSLMATAEEGATTQPCVDDDDCKGLEGVKSGQKKPTSLQKQLEAAAKVTVPTLLVIGLFGNTMTIVVLQGKQFHKMVTVLILNIMSPFNKKFFLTWLGSDPRAMSEAGCKIFFWFWRTSKMTSSWLVVLISLERFVAVILPLRVHQICSTRNVRLAVALVYFGIGSFNAVWGYMCDSIINGACIPNKVVGREDLERGMVIVGTAIYSLLPAIFILTLNICIILRLLSSRRKRKQLAQVSQAGDKQTLMMTSMLVGVAIAFIILVVPIGSMHVLTTIWKKPFFQTDDQTISIVREITQVMEQLNYSINFFLYVLCCQKFRAEFRRIFCSPIMRARQLPSLGSSTKETSG